MACPVPGGYLIQYSVDMKRRPAHADDPARVYVNRGHMRHMWLLATVGPRKALQTSSLISNSLQGDDGGASSALRLSVTAGGESFSVRPAAMSCAE